MAKRVSYGPWWTNPDCELFKERETLLRRRLLEQPPPGRKALAIELILSTTQLVEFAARTNVELPELGWKPFSADDKKKILKRHEQGQSVRHIAKAMDRSEASIRDFLKSQGKKLHGHIARGGNWIEGAVGAFAAAELRKLLKVEQMKEPKRRLSRADLAQELTKAIKDNAEADERVVGTRQLYEIAVRYGVQLLSGQVPVVTNANEDCVLELADPVPDANVERQGTTVSELMKLSGLAPEKLKYWLPEENCRRVEAGQPLLVPPISELMKLTGLERNDVRGVIGRENRRRANAGDHQLIELPKAHTSGRGPLTPTDKQAIRGYVKKADDKRVAVARLADAYDRSICTIRRTAGLATSREALQAQSNGSKTRERPRRARAAKIPSKRSSLFVDSDNVLFVPTRGDYTVRSDILAGKTISDAGLPSAIQRLKRRNEFMPYMEQIRAWFMGEDLPAWFNVPGEKQRDVMERATATIYFAEGLLSRHHTIWRGTLVNDKQIPWTPSDLWKWVRFIYAGIKLDDRYVIEVAGQKLRRVSARILRNLYEYRQRPSLKEALRKIHAEVDRAPLSKQARVRIENICAPFRATTRRVLLRHAADWQDRFDVAGVTRDQRRQMLKQAEQIGGKDAREGLAAFLDGDPTLPDSDIPIQVDRPIWDSESIVNLPFGVWTYAERARELGKDAWHDEELLAFPCFRAWMLDWLGLDATREPPKFNRRLRQVICPGYPSVKLTGAESDVLASLIHGGQMTGNELTSETIRTGRPAGVARPDRILYAICRKLPAEFQIAIRFPGKTSRKYTTNIKFV